MILRDATILSLPWYGARPSQSAWTCSFMVVASLYLSIYIYIHTYVVAPKRGPSFGFFETKLGPRLRQNLVQDFVLLVFPSSTVFWGMLKITNSL